MLHLGVDTRWRHPRLERGAVPVQDVLDEAVGRELAGREAT
jgi:hypothetical protein